MLSKVFDKKLLNLYVAILIIIIAHCVSPTMDIKVFDYKFEFKYVFESFYILAWFIAGFRVLKKCIENIKLKEYFDENLLMTSATLGAILIGYYNEAVSVMILYCIGEYFQEKAVNKSRKSISDLINIRCKYANVERDNKLVKVNPEDITIGEVIIIKPGEKIPLDGKIISGKSSINVSALTGESMPKDVKEGDYVLSGSINLNGILRIRTDKLYYDSTVYKILNLIENAKRSKTNTENFITKFAKIYTPLVLFLALMIVVVPIFIYAYNHNWHFNLQSIKFYISYALMFLVISCPCALVISVPLTFFAGIGVASRQGILIKGEKYLESLANIKTAVFDKTGTLTKADYKVSKIELSQGTKMEEMAESVIKVESKSNHPIALALKEAFKNEAGKYLRYGYNITEIPGKGMWYTSDKTEILVGNKELMNEYGVTIFDINNENLFGAKIFVAKNKKYLGYIVLEDEIKQSARIIITKLKELGIQSIILTGDIKENTEKVARKVGIKEYYCELLPEDKVNKMETFMKNNKTGKTIIYVGDGINDAAILARSDTGIAMGAMGSDIAVQSADVVIADDNLTKIYIAIQIAKKTVDVAKKNIILAISTKVIFLILVLLGFMKMWLAIFADTGITLITIFNALTIIKMKKELK